MSKSFVYKLTVDNGGAPCVSEDLLTLAICKPSVRSAADLGAGYGYLADALLMKCAGITTLAVYEAEHRALQLAKTNLAK